MLEWKGKVPHRICSHFSKPTQPFRAAHCHAGPCTREMCGKVFCKNPKRLVRLYMSAGLSLSVDFNKDGNTIIAIIRTQTIEQILCVCDYFYGVS